MHDIQEERNKILNHLNDKLNIKKHDKFIEAYPSNRTVSTNITSNYEQNITTDSESEFEKRFNELKQKYSNYDINDIVN